jgi:hypothetical protein
LTNAPQLRVSRSHALGLVGLVAIVAIAFGLRISGVAYDSPYVYHPDEYAIAKPAMNMVATGDPDPHVFTYPSLLLYAETAIVHVVHAATGASLDTSATPGYGSLLGLSGSNLDPSQYPYVLWGRMLVVLFGTMTVLLLAIAGLVAARTRRRTPASGVVKSEPPGPEQGPPAGRQDNRLGWLAGLAGASFFALAILPLDNSRYLTTDIPTAFFATATLLATLAAMARAPDRTANRLLMLAGLFVGLATSTKYTAAVLAIVPAAAYLTRAGSLEAVPGWLPGAIRSRTPYLVGLAAAAGFVVTTPMILFDTRALLHGAMSEVLHYNVEGHAGAEGDSLRFYIGYLWNTGFGPILSVLSLAGVALALWRRRAADLVLVIFPLAYFLLVSIPKVHFERNLLPMVPFVALLAGRFVAEAATALHGLVARRRPWLGSAAAAVLLASLVLQPAAAAVGDAQAGSLPRTETIALGWANEHLAPGAAIVREEYTPQMDPVRFRVGWIWTLSSHDIAWYRSRGFRYVIASSRAYARYFEPGYPAEKSFYSDLFELTTVYRIDPSSTTAGPTIVILDLQPGP